jgi:uncharacterized protein YndB with AHSA1/START domain
MSAATRSQFVYVTYIRTTCATLWDALTLPQVIRRYWFGATIECGWSAGSPWILRAPDGSVSDRGEVVEIDPQRHVVIRWTNEWKPEFKAEGPSRCTIELQPVDASVKLTVTHETERPESGFIAAVSAAWPLTLSNLKSLLETGEVAVAAHPGH